MKIVRKQLSNTEIQPAGTRWNSGTDTIQTTPDGGTTWNDAPGLDIRHADSFRLPPLTGGTAQCDAAARMAAYVNVQVDNFLNAGSLAQAATGALGVLLLLAGGAGIIIDAILAGMDVLITIGATAISSAFNVTTYENLKCTFDCHLDVNGQMTAAGLAAFQADVFLNYSSTVYSTMVVIGAFTGEVQYSNAGVERSETGDCTACACDHCFNLILSGSDGSAHGLTIQGGTYIPGTGWQGAANGEGGTDLYGFWTFPSTLHVKSVTMEFYKGGGAGGDDVNHMNTLYPTATGYSTVTLAQDATNPTDPAAHLFKTMLPNTDLAGLGFDINSGSFPTLCQLYCLQVIYSGTEVFGGDNC